MGLGCFENRPKFQVLMKGLFQEGPGLGAAFSQPERAKTYVFLCSNLLIIACCPYEGLFSTNMLKVGRKVDYGMGKKAALFWQKAGCGICSLMGRTCYWEEENCFLKLARDSFLSVQ